MVDDYVSYLRRRGYAASTIEQRTYQARAWCSWIGDRFARATRHDVERWVDTLGVAPRTAYTRVSNLAQFYRWALREELADVDPTATVDRPRFRAGLPRPARRVDAEMIIALAAPDDRRMLTLMADAGLRCVEVSRLRWRDVDAAAGTLHVRGKGGRERLVGMTGRLVELLDVAGDPEEPVIGRRRGYLLDGRGVSVRARRVIRSFGGEFTGHQLRHLYATRLLDATDNLIVVQRALGHSSVATTQVYADVTASRVVAAARALD